MPRVAALFKHWQKCPPVHRAVAIIAATLGYSANDAQTVAPADAANDTQQYIDALPMKAPRRAGS